MFDNRKTFTVEITLRPWPRDPRMIFFRTCPRTRRLLILIFPIEALRKNAIEITFARRSNTVHRDLTSRYIVHAHFGVHRAIQ